MLNGRAGILQGKCTVDGNSQFAGLHRAVQIGMHAPGDLAHFGDRSIGCGM